MDISDRIALSIPDACKAGGFSRSFAYDEIKARRLESVKVGGRRLILRSDLEAYFERCKREAA